jgi:hypothetical protein
MNLQGILQEKNKKLKKKNFFPTMLTMKYLEVLWTGTKHKFMCFNELAFSSQSYINQYFFLQQTVKHSHESTMVIVPFQAEFVVGVHRRYR